MNATPPSEPASAAAFVMNADGLTGYFAYGSNLSKQQMLQRIGHIPASQQARLQHHRLAFNCHADQEFYANVMPSEGDALWGVIYLCDRCAMLTLDHYEGVAQGCYRRTQVDIETAAGEQRQVEIYLAAASRLLRDGQPSLVYLDRILVGAKEHALPAEYIREIRKLATSVSA